VNYKTCGCRINLIGKEGRGSSGIEFSTRPIWSPPGPGDRQGPLTGRWLREERSSSPPIAEFRHQHKWLTCHQDRLAG